MPTEWISVIGSIASDRVQEIALTSVESAANTAALLGKALAERGYGLIVYSSEGMFVESAVVAGYLDSEKAEPESIRVLYPRDRETRTVPSFPRYRERANCFRLELDENPRWETSFYLSLKSCSGALLMGGGRSTFVAGIVARVLEKPVLALDAFGGASSEVWEMLDLNEDFITDQDRRKLADQGDLTWALSVVDIISNSRRRRADARNEMDLELGLSHRLLNSQAIAALAAFVLSAVLIVFTWDNGALSRVELLTCLVASPLLAGFSGAFIRRVADVYQGNPLDVKRSSTMILGILGAIAGGFSGLLFVMPQLTATMPDPLSHTLPSQISRLVPFSMITGFLAGFTANLVYEKLREAKALDGAPVEDLLKGAEHKVP